MAGSLISSGRATWRRWFLSALLIAPLLGACGSTQGDYPRAGALLPGVGLHLASGNVASLEKLAMASLGAGALYVLYDPLAPNWSIEEVSVDEEIYHLSMRAKSFRVGGDGEARQIFKRRAGQLQREKGFASYRIVEYSEGVESSTPFTQRYAEGTIQLVRSDAARP